VRTVLVHIDGGHRVAYDLDDRTADAIVAAVREYWHRPDAFPPDARLELAMVDDDGGQAWIPLGRVTAIQSLPITAGEADGTEEG
jgi:hypothetical protein